ncbi:class I SAM-dependent methyltransferase [Litchfieldia salsa]|uniref:Site-specific DNA-methyltransferase (Adenine-specific) n=1 Tax=Litchfieldia salsa TaxID=930152 RepID=A0A1H0P5A0_9BACI|nr:class I SAM-dependent methyltransferase [Litchfieldia salsa]SDO99860.1 site-specific DNA-methyltransferase (adenine-specific) [Litchfieldia salsa]
MEQRSQVEILFTIIDETATLLKEELSCTYIEAVAETGENIFQQSILQENISELNKKRLEKEYSSILKRNYSNEEIRKAYQLAILKGMHEGAQVNHQMTPDAVALFMGYLVRKLSHDKEEVAIFDPAIGTGNLLTAIMNQNTGKTINAFGSDIDDLLIKLSYVNANLQKHNIQLYNQDSLEPLYVDPVDVIVCDLPYGYYPNDVNASNYKMKADTGHSYAHHLFIEQSYKYIKPGGYLVLLIPNALFESAEANKLNTFITENMHIQGLIQLPSTMFKKKEAAKSVFILQKKAENVLAPKQALLASLPSFSNRDSMARMIQQIDQWFEDEKESVEKTH